MSKATLVRKDGGTFTAEVPRGCPTVVVPAHARAFAADLLDMGLMGRLTQTTYRLGGDGRYYEGETTGPHEVRRTWPLW